MLSFNLEKDGSISCLLTENNYTFSIGVIKKDKFYPSMSTPPLGIGQLWMICEQIRNQVGN